MDFTLPVCHFQSSNVQDWLASLSEMKLPGRVLPMGDDTALDSSDESVIVTWCETMSLGCIGALPLSNRDEKDPELPDGRCDCRALQ